MYICSIKQILPGGLPGETMKITENKQLKELATQAGTTANELSNNFIAELIRRQIIEDTPDVYGATIADAINRDIKITEFVDAMRVVGIPTISKNYDAIMEMVVVGNGDCPECGGEMEVTDGEYKQTGGDGYIAPSEYTAIWEEKTCTLCGYKESNEPDYE